MEQSAKLTLSDTDKSPATTSNGLAAHNEHNNLNHAANGTNAANNLSTSNGQSNGHEIQADQINETMSGYADNQASSVNGPQKNGHQKTNGKLAEESDNPESVSDSKQKNKKSAKNSQSKSQSADNSNETVISQNGPHLANSNSEKCHEAEVGANKQVSNGANDSVQANFDVTNRSKVNGLNASESNEVAKREEPNIRNSKALASENGSSEKDQGQDPSQHKNGTFPSKTSPHPPDSVASLDLTKHSQLVVSDVQSLSDLSNQPSLNPMTLDLISQIKSNPDGPETARILEALGKVSNGDPSTSNVAKEILMTALSNDANSNVQKKCKETLLAALNGNEMLPPELIQHLNETIKDASQASSNFLDNIVGSTTGNNGTLQGLAILQECLNQDQNMLNNAALSNLIVQNLKSPGNTLMSENAQNPMAKNINQENKSIEPQALLQLIKAATQTNNENTESQGLQQLLLAVSQDDSTIEASALQQAIQAAVQSNASGNVSSSPEVLQQVIQAIVPNNDLARNSAQNPNIMPQELRLLLGNAQSNNASEELCSNPKGLQQLIQSVAENSMFANSSEANSRESQDIKKSLHALDNIINSATGKQGTSNIPQVLQEVIQATINDNNHSNHSLGQLSKADIVKLSAALSNESKDLDPLDSQISNNYSSEMQECINSAIDPNNLANQLKKFVSQNGPSGILDMQDTKQIADIVDLANILNGKGTMQLLGPNTPKLLSKVVGESVDLGAAQDIANSPDQIQQLLQDIVMSTNSNNSSQISNMPTSDIPNNVDKLVKSDRMKDIAQDPEASHRLPSDVKGLPQDSQQNVLNHILNAINSGVDPLQKAALSQLVNQSVSNSNILNIENSGTLTDIIKRNAQVNKNPPVAQSLDNSLDSNGNAQLIKLCQNLNNGPLAMDTLSQVLPQELVSQLFGQNLNVTDTVESLNANQRCQNSLQTNATNESTRQVGGPSGINSTQSSQITSKMLQSLMDDNLEPNSSSDLLAAVARHAMINEPLGQDSSTTAMLNGLKNLASLGVNSNNFTARSLSNALSDLDSKISNKDDFVQALVHNLASEEELTRLIHLQTSESTNNDRPRLPADIKTTMKVPDSLDVNARLNPQCPNPSSYPTQTQDAAGKNILAGKPNGYLTFFGISLLHAIHV